MMRAKYRKATLADLPAVTAIYDGIHTMEEAGLAEIGWRRGVYPTEETARKAILAEELFVEEVSGKIVASARINQEQMEAYSQGDWSEKADDSRVMVMHTLTVAPECRGRGYGSAFVGFYETYARNHACPVLRMDTNARNHLARALYRRLGYREAGIIPCAFNGLKDVQLVLLEKILAE